MVSYASAFVIVFIVLVSSAAGHNITSILGEYPDFASFNQILSQTKIADEINSRQSVTVLVVANSELDAVSGRPLDQVENIIRVHVVLDYYDPAKLTKLSKNSAILTTLFQATGHSSGQSGFINATDLEEGKVAFGSAVVGAGLDVYLVKSVAAQPYNISVLQVSGLIVPPNIDHAAILTPANPPLASIPISSPKAVAAPPTKSNTAANPPSTIAATPAPTTAAAPEKSHAAPAPTTTATPVAAPPKKADVAIPAAAPTKYDAAAAPTTTTTSIAAPPNNAYVATPAAAPAKDATAAAAVPSSGSDDDDDDVIGGASPSEAPVGEEYPVFAAPADAPARTRLAPVPSIAEVPVASNDDGPTPAAGPAPDAADKAKSSASRIMVGSAITFAMGATLLRAF